MTDTNFNTKRECGECTACCEGWLAGTIYGREMKAGKKCHFLGTNRCSIYPDRPQSPCKNFNCAWVQDEKSVFPEWLKPSLSKVIMTWEKWGNDFPYLKVVECGQKMDSAVLSWLVQYSLNESMPVLYQIEKSRYVLGPPDFYDEMSKKYQFLS
jgi:hypothetical protein